MPRRVKVIEKKLGKNLGQVMRAAGELEIEIDPRQSPKEYLDTLIHEALHIARPELSEDCVTKTATELTRVLWQQNYRKVSQ